MWFETFIFFLVTFSSLKGDEIIVDDPLEDENFYNADLETMKDFMTHLGPPGEDQNQPELHRAALNGEKTKVQELLNRGLSARILNSKGETALHFAVMGGYTEVANLLIQNGVNVNAQDTSSSMSALHLAVLAGNIYMARFLLQSGASLELTNSNSHTALHQAVLLNDLPMVKYLADEAHADVNALTNEGMNSFLIAIEKGFLDIALFLVSKGANYNVRNSQGTSCLHFAAFWGLQEIMKLCSAGNGFNVVDNEGFTPLHFCALSGKTAACKWLLKRGASILAVTYDDQSAEELASANNHLETALILEGFKMSNSRLVTHLINSMAANDLASKNIDIYVLFVKPQQETVRQSRTQSDHFVSTAKSNAALWSGVYDSIAKNYINTFVFRQTFFEKMDELDERYPGVLRNRTENEIRIKLNQQQQGSKVFLKNFENQLRQVNPDTNINLQRVDEFIKFFLIYSKKYHATAQTSLTELMNFQRKLSQDRANFVEAKANIKSSSAGFTDEIIKLGKEIQSKVDMRSSLIDQTLEKIRQVDAAQKGISIFYTSSTIYHGIAAIPSVVNLVKKGSQWLKNLQKIEGCKDTAKFFSKATFAKKLKKITRPFTALKTAIKTNVQASKYGSKALKVFKMAAKPLKLVGKALPFISVGLDIAMLGLSIYELENHKTKSKEWKESVKKINSGAEDASRLMLKYRQLEIKSAAIAKSSETKLRISKMLDDVGQHVDLLVAESVDLVDHWAALEETLENLHRQTSETHRQRNASGVLRDVGGQLQRMYEEWKSSQPSTFTLVLKSL